ncbi:hypothetical protein, partial [Nonomuraea fuscirosea]|uniref:hypothetical protein n=1 Tax=Nonomuraea fuscirosea TaxID=1291556 RepID=UPI00341BF041
PWARLQAALAAPAQSLRETDTQAVIDTSPWPWGALASHGGCSLRNEYSRFSLNWSINGGEEALGLARKNFGSTRLSELPADLGKGLIAYTGGIPRSKPYVAFILFRCGKNQPWMGTSLSQVAKERNVVKDLTDLLHIARDRYGKAHSCTPEAA